MNMKSETVKPTYTALIRNRTEAWGFRYLLQVITPSGDIAIQKQFDTVKDAKDNLKRLRRQMGAKILLEEQY